MSIEEMKQRWIDGSLDHGIFTSTNEKGQNVHVCVHDKGFELTTYQDNGWARTNIYTYDADRDTWDYEEIYDK